MNKSIRFALAALFVSSAASLNFAAAQPAPAGNDSSPAAIAQPSNAVMIDLSNLVAQVNEKIKQDKTTEADLADNLKEFDVLAAKHKDAPAEDRAMILASKAQLYIEVLQEPEKALPIFKQIKTEFPTTRIGGRADDVIAYLQGMVERKEAREKLTAGNVFPDFHETDVQGKPLSISQFKGKVVLVDFWATWCPPCVMEVPEIQKAYEKFHAQGFEIVGISLDEDKDRLQHFTADKKMTWPEFFDGKKWENKLAVKYGVDSTPTSYLLDRNGKIIKKIDAGEDLESEIAQALKQ